WRTLNLSGHGPTPPMSNRRDRSPPGGVVRTTGVHTPMPSPFPGMDPYLEDERLWPAFQHQLVNCLYQILLPGLVDRYRARVGQRVYVTEQALFTSVIRDEHQEEFIEIRQRNDGRLVTLVEVVSPSNKTTDPGRQAYLGKRREAKSAGASLVEIDLVLQGD